MFIFLYDTSFKKYIVSLHNIFSFFESYLEISLTTFQELFEGTIRNFRGPSESTITNIPGAA